MQPPTVALQRFNSLDYTLDEVYARRDPEAYLQDMIVYGTTSGQATTEAAQVQAAYNKMTASLQQHLVRPTGSTTVAEFAAQENVRKNQWFELYKRRSSRVNDSNSRQRDARDQPGNRRSLKRWPKDQSRSEATVNKANSGDLPRGAEESSFRLRVRCLQCWHMQ
ncbi:hypothetical protein N7454_003220 [Penicillium verhagenii]|nr:hypothetical protein N7454_003220 [Penicillium verhagenii]